MLDDLPSKIR